MAASIAAPSYWVMAALRAVTGIGAAGQSHCIFLLSTEPVGPDFRFVILNSAASHSRWLCWVL
jgi:hypothetical protein